MANDDKPGPIFKSDAYKLMREAATIAVKQPGTAGAGMDIVRRFVIVQAFEHLIALLIQDGSAQAVGEVAGAINLLSMKVDAIFGKWSEADRKIAAAAAADSTGALAGLLVAEGLATAVKIPMPDDPPPNAEAN